MNKTDQLGPEVEQYNPYTGKNTLKFIFDKDLVSRIY